MARSRRLFKKRWEPVSRFRMRKLHVGIIDIVSRGPTRALYARVMNPNLASIMPQVIGVWCRNAGHEEGSSGQLGHDVLRRGAVAGLLALNYIAHDEFRAAFIVMAVAGQGAARSALRRIRQVRHLPPPPHFSLWYTGQP